MILLNFLMRFFLIVALISFFYKMRYHLNEKNKKGSNFLQFFFSKYLLIGINTFLPLRSRPNTSQGNQNRKKANIALLVFYLSIMLSVCFAEIVKHI